MESFGVAFTYLTGTHICILVFACKVDTGVDFSEVHFCTLCIILCWFPAWPLPRLKKGKPLLLSDLTCWLLYGLFRIQRLGFDVILAVKLLASFTGFPNLVPNKRLPHIKQYMI